jgi:hypothetical protein
MSYQKSGVVGWCGGKHGYFSLTMSVHIPFCHISLPISNIHFFLFDITENLFFYNNIVLSLSKKKKKEIVLLPFAVLL